MSQIPRPLVETEVPCPECGTALTITFDALNRPRHRCRQCHGVTTTPLDAGVVARVATPEPGLERVPPSREQRNRLLQTVRPLLAPRVSARRCCLDCGAVLPAQSTGRPRLRCAERAACQQRQRGAA